MRDVQLNVNSAASSRRQCRTRVVRGQHKKRMLKTSPPTTTATATTTTTANGCDRFCIAREFMIELRAGLCRFLCEFAAVMLYVMLRVYAARLCCCAASSAHIFSVTSSMCVDVCVCVCAFSRTRATTTTRVKCMRVTATLVRARENGRKRSHRILQGMALSNWIISHKS